MTNRREKLAAALLRPINPAAVVFLGIYTTLWGAWVANPFWNVFDQAELYSKLQRVSEFGINPEFFWGGVAIVCGLFIWYGAVKRSYKSLIRGALVAFFHWLMIGVFYLWGDWHNTGGITSLTFAVYAAFVWLNIRINHKDSDCLFDE